MVTIVTGVITVMLLYVQLLIWLIYHAMMRAQAKLYM